MTIERGVLLLDALTFLGFAIAFFLFPDEMIGMVGINLESDGSVTEIRGFYGGLQFGVALFLGHCAQHQQQVRLGLLAATMALGSLALARALGTAYDRTLSDMWLLLTLEGSGALVSLWAYRRCT